MKLFEPYRLARTLFWALPGSLRNRLDSFRYRLVRFWRTNRTLASVRSDKNWAEFCTQVLDCKASSTLICVFEPTIDWGVTLFQRPQHMAMALGRKGCIVLYRTTGDGTSGVRKIAPNVWLVNTTKVEKLRDAVWCFYSTASLCSPKQMADRRIGGRVVYEYIDHIDSLISGSKSEVQRLLALKAAACSGQADWIVASSLALHDEVMKLNSGATVSYIPNGVDVDHFRDGRHAHTPLPDQFVKFRRQYRKLIGYFGAIAPWLWFDIIKELSEELPDVGFVYIGPDYSSCARKLPRSKNFLYLGAVDYDALPAYAMHFDVCTIPFSPGPIAQTTSPLKLYEYFALEKPVVVTSDMKECTSYQEVFSGSNTPTLINAIKDAFVASEISAYRKSVLHLAYANSWDIRAEAYLEMLQSKG